MITKALGSGNADTNLTNCAFAKQHCNFLQKDIFTLGPAISVPSEVLQWLD
jgi:hypothetical protein